MPLNTNLNTRPYYDDFNVSKNYYKILFQPGVSVQTRELNQLQSILQNQIEQFGDNIFTVGTVISGCNFNFLNPYPYIKIRDQNFDSVPTTPALYKGYQILNESTGLLAQIINSADGFESGPNGNVKTLYLNYLNSGNDGNTFVFSAGDTLKIFNNQQNGIENISVANSGAGFSNLDTVVAVSAINVNVTSGAFTNGSYVSDGVNANLQIVGIISNTVSNTTILQLAPRITDLANAAGNSAAWTIANGSSISMVGGGASGKVLGVIGSGFHANVITDSTGTIIAARLISKGIGFNVIPFISVQSANNAGGLSTLTITPQNWIDKITVAPVNVAADPVGTGYAFSVSSGVIYQKGYFLRVSPQTVIVSRYDVLPDNVAAAFITSETIVQSSADSSLNDPAATVNYNAPGADRMMIVPNLVIVDANTAASNASILPLVGWNDGNPFYQQQQTLYNVIGDTMAQRTYEQSGNFYVDPFYANTMTAVSNNNGSNFDIVIDPGTAYIDGYRVSTTKNYHLRSLKGINSAIQNNNITPLKYQNFIKLYNVGGNFPFNTGATVQLYDTAKGFLSNTDLIAAGNTNPVGTNIGVASMRSMELASGVPGTNTAVYNLYLFNVQMNPGYSFANAKAVYYNDTLEGIADIVQVPSANGGNIALITTSNNDSLIFGTGSIGVMKNANNLSYMYRTSDPAVSMANTGIATKSISGSPNETFPYEAASPLTQGNLEDLYVVPTSNNLVAYANISGTISVNTTSANLVGTSTHFTTELVVGDYLTIVNPANTNQKDLRQITQIVSDTAAVTNKVFDFANTSSAAYRTFPQNVPIPFGVRAGLSANLDLSQQVLTINLGMSLSATSAQTLTLQTNIQRSSVDQLTKTPNRKQFVKINLANNAGGTQGPWCLGVPDIFRMRGVWVGDSSVSNTGANHFSSFYIDHNQTTDYYGLGWLFAKNDNTVHLTAANYLLVEFDYFTPSSTSGGVFDISSYISSNSATVYATDILPLANLTSSVNTLEIPELFDNKGNSIDLMQVFDFRPYAANTVAPSTNPATAPVNPGNTTTIAVSEHKFPYPGSSLISNIESYLPRIDSAYVNKTGNIFGIFGTVTAKNSKSPANQPGSIKIADIFIPGYPSIPSNPSYTEFEIMNKGIANQKYSFSRLGRQSISLLSLITNNQTKVYEMSDIAKIDRRLAAVENYVSLNQLESNVSSMTIPSSLDPTVNRFKYGFFADDFTTTNFMDLSNPNYRAGYENGDIVPSKFRWTLGFNTNFAGNIPYVEQNIMTQLNATTGTLDNPYAPGPVCALGIANSVAYTLAMRDYTATGTFGSSGANGHVDSYSVTLADASHMANSYANGNYLGSDFWSANSIGTSSVELFFYAYDNPVKFQIFQGTTEVANSNSAVALTANDITNLTGNTTNYWFKTNETGAVSAFDANGYVLYAGKVTLNYTGTGSQNLNIVVSPGANAWRWKWVLSYPINGSAAGCQPPVHVCANGYTWDPVTQQCLENVANNVVTDPGPHICPDGYRAVWQPGANTIVKTTTTTSYTLSLNNNDWATINSFGQKNYKLTYPSLDAIPTSNVRQDVFNVWDVSSTDGGMLVNGQTKWIHITTTQKVGPFGLITVKPGYYWDHGMWWLYPAKLSTDTKTVNVYGPSTNGSWKCVPVVTYDYTTADYGGGNVGPQNQVGQITLLDRSLGKINPSGDGLNVSTSSPDGRGDGYVVGNYYYDQVGGGTVLNQGVVAAINQQPELVSALGALVTSGAASQFATMGPAGAQITVTPNGGESFNGSINPTTYNLLGDSSTGTVTLFNTNVPGDVTVLHYNDTTGQFDQVPFS